MKYLFHKRTAYRSLRKGLIIMKLIVFILFAFIFQASAGVNAQKISINAENLPLEKVCKEIERQTGYYFVYATNINTSSQLVNIHLNEVELRDGLDKIFTPTIFKYQLIDKVIIINTKLIKQANIIIDTGGVVDLSGTILSDQGLPLEGATVSILHSSKSIFTNARGDFHLKKVPLGSVLSITYIGFLEQRSIINSSEPIRVRLQSSNSVLDAPVVKGYYTTSNRLNTGNTVVIKGEDIQKQPVSDPILALEGRVANLSITQSSGIAGAYSTVRLRGRNSIDNGLDPLYIIDGVPYTNTPISNAEIASVLGNPSRPGNPPQNNGTGYSPFNNINPNDIESITILKDADATAIYGSRGANGVILITTKKGKYGQTKVDVNLQAGGGRVTKRLKMLDTHQYLKMRREALKFAGRLPNPNIDYDLTYWDTTRYTDWQKMLLGNTASFYNGQVNISGGGGNTQFMIGIGYNDQGNTFPGTYRDKKSSILANISNSSSNRRFHSELTIQYTNDNNRLPTTDFLTSLTLAPNAPTIYDKYGNLNWQLRNGLATWQNPIAKTRNRAKSSTDNYIAGLTLNYSLLDGLKLSTRFGYVNTKMAQSNVIPATSFAPVFANNPSFRSNNYGNSSLTNWVVEPQINYDLHNKNSLLQIIIGGTLQESNYYSLGEAAGGFSSDALIDNPLAASQVQVVNYYVSKYRYDAVYGRVSYTYTDKFLINLTARRDGSSRFGPGKQFGNFGAIGLGWIFSQEKVLSNKFAFLSFGKIRTSYGITGNDQLPDYKYIDTYTPIGTSYQNSTGLYPTQITNKNYSWETVKKFEVALDLGFFKDRLFFTAAYYRNRTDNQLVGYTLPLITGFSSVQANFPAIIQNSGLELTLASLNIKKKNFSWQCNVNLGLNRNKLISYPGIESSGYQYTYSTGKSLSTRYLYHFVGVDPETGQYSFATKAGDNNPIFGVDGYFSRPITQDYQGGFSNSLTLGDFQVDFLIQFVKQTGINYISSMRQSGLVNYNIPVVFSDTWNGYGDKSIYAKVSSVYNPNMAVLNESDAIITDASFIRLKNISLSYNVKEVNAKKVRLNGLRLYVQGQNVLTLTNYLGFDPENQGFSIPPLKMVTGGIHLTF